MGELEYGNKPEDQGRISKRGWCQVERYAIVLFARVPELYKIDGQVHERTLHNRVVVPSCVLLSENGGSMMLERKSGRAKTVIRCSFTDIET